MYAIIRSGGKQTKVREGDVIDVERVRSDGEFTFTPLLVVDDKGKVYSSRDELKSAKVTVKVVGESAGDKVEIFKYKAKTGYRKRGGHRQKYTTLEVLKIDLPKKQSAKSATDDAADDAAPKTAAKTAPEDSAEKKPAAKKPAAKKPAAKKPATKAAAATKPAAKKTAAKKPAAKKPAAKKPAAKKPEPEKES